MCACYYHCHCVNFLGQVPTTSQTCIHLCAAPPPLFRTTPSPYGFKTRKRQWQTGSRCTLPFREVLAAWWLGGGGLPRSPSTPPCPHRAAWLHLEVVAAMWITTMDRSPSGTAFWRKAVVWEVSAYCSYNVENSLSTVTGGSCHKYHFCRDKTHLLSQQKYVCCDETIVATKIFCCDKHNFVTTILLLQQAYFCCGRRHVLLHQTCFCSDKSACCFVVTKLCLLPQIFVATHVCHNKHNFVATSIFLSQQNDTWSSSCHWHSTGVILKGLSRWKVAWCFVYHVCCVLCLHL